MKLPNTLKHASFIYDFASDGGSIGSINMGDFISPNCEIIVGHIKVLNTLTFAAGATISIGWAGDNQNLVNDTLASLFTANTIIPGVDLLRFPVGVTDEIELQVTIKTGAILSGRFVYFCSYMENDGGAGNNFPPLPPLRGISVDIISTTLIVYP